MVEATISVGDTCLSAGESKEVLKGTTFEVYRFLLKNGKPVGIRELQRALNLSSPSVATYHLSKLEDAGLIRRKDGNYVVAKYLLDHSVKVSHFLIPRYFFYAFFAWVVLVLELTLMKPMFVSREYIFSTVATAMFVFFLSYETAKTWLKGSL
jgi:DNA-binding transcriptional ArsR family regulator